MKKLHIEALRIIAIFFVIFNHTGTFGFQAYLKTNNDILYIIYLFMAILCKISVPIFFMISGALLLGKDESISCLYKKRISRILIVLLLFSSLQYTYSLYINVGEFNIIEFLKIIYNGPIIIPYWYLYSYLSFLVVLPLLRKMVKKMDKTDYIYLFTIWIGITFITSIIEKKTGLSMYDRLTCVFLKDSIFFPIAGYFCETYFEDCKKKNIFIVLFIFSILCIGISGYFTWSDINITGDLKTQKWLGTFIAVPTIFTYLFMKFIFDKIVVNEKASKLLCTVGGCTFGIYLIEEVLRNLFFYKFLYLLKPFIKTMPACLISITFIIIIGIVIVLILKRIPLLKDIL